MAPQDGRFFEASNDKRKLVICKSLLYSFKTNEEAPFKLFSRWAHITLPESGNKSGKENIKVIVNL
jgi:hypothetical protein